MPWLLEPMLAQSTSCPRVPAGPLSVGREVLCVAPAARLDRGTFLLALTAGLVRQLDVVQEDLHQKARYASAGPP
jgi:hypothetical protein